MADKTDLADAETIQGLWRALLRYVPKRSREEALALANVLHYLLANEATDKLQATERAAYARGLTDGEKAGRSAAEWAYRKLALDNGIILDLDTPQPKDIQH